MTTSRTDPLHWLRAHDPGLSALRRAGRAALVMPALFALGSQVIGNPTVSIFAAIGSFAMLLLVDFGGPIRSRLQAQAALAATGAVFVCIGTLASRSPWAAAVAMAIVGFGVLFAGVVSSVLAGATVALLLAFILPVSLAGPASSIPDRLAGWGLASAASFSVGAAMPLLMVVVSPAGKLVPIVFAASLGFLALLGALGARAGGANVLRATARVTFWGALALAITAGIGKLFGTVV